MPQLLAYLCLHSIGVVLVMSEADAKWKNFLRSGVVIVASLAIGVGYITQNMNDSETAMFCTFFALHNCFLILGTEVATRFVSSARAMSTFRYLAIALNILFFYLYQAHPEYVGFTKWWIGSGLFYMSHLNVAIGELWTSFLIIALLIVSAAMFLNKKSQLNV